MERYVLNCNETSLCSRAIQMHTLVSKCHLTMRLFSQGPVCLHWDCLGEPRPECEKAGHGQISDFSIMEWFLTSRSKYCYAKAIVNCVASLYFRPCVDLGIGQWQNGRGMLDCAQRNIV
jgi:hypothetical protein